MLYRDSYVATVRQNDSEFSLHVVYKHFCVKTAIEHWRTWALITHYYTYIIIYIYNYMYNSRGSPPSASFHCYICALLTTFQRWNCLWSRVWCCVAAVCCWKRKSVYFLCKTKMVDSRFLVPATGEVKTKLLAQCSSEGCLSFAGRNNSLSWHLAKTLLPKHPTILVNKSCRITCDFVWNHLNKQKLWNHLYYVD